MSFISFENGTLRIGESAALTLREVITELMDLQEKKDLSAAEALDSLLSGSSVQKVKKELLLALKNWVAKKTSRSLSDLLTSLREIELRSEKEDRQLGWPAKSWSTPFSGKLSEGEYAFSIKAEGGIYFEVLADGTSGPDGLDGFEKYDAVGALVMEGEVSANASGSIPIPVGGISASAKTSLQRSMSQYFSFESHDQISGLALASSLSQFGNPSDGENLLKSFNAGKSAKLRGIVIEGEGEIGGSAGITANFPTAYGTPGIKLGGKLQTSRSFRYVVEPEDEQSLSLKVVAGSSRSSEFDLAASYTVGLSSISPYAANKLLQAITDINELVKKIDDKAGEVIGNIKTLLKPGDYIKEKLQDQIGKVIKQQTKNGDFTIVGGLGKLLGLDIAQDSKVDDFLDPISSQFASVFADILDEIPDVFGMSKENLQKKLSDSIIGAVDPKVTTVLNEEVFSKISSELNKALEDFTSKLNKTVKTKINKSLGYDGEAKLDQIREFFTEARRISQNILESISNAQTDLISAEIGWRKQVTSGLGFDYEVIFDMSESVAISDFNKAVLSPAGFGEILLDKNLSNGVEIVDFSRQSSLVKETGHRWSIAFIGIDLGGSTKNLKNISVVDTPDGVTIVSAGTASKTRSFWKETRTASFLTAMNLWRSKLEGDAVEPLSAASIKINFTEIDKDIHVKEAKKTMERFVKAGLLNPLISEEVVQRLTALKKSNGKNDVHAQLAMGISIPPEQVINILKQVSEGMGDVKGLTIHRGLFTDFTIFALADYDPTSVDEAMTEVIKIEDESTDNFSLLGAGKSLADASDNEEDKFDTRVEFLMALSGNDPESAAKGVSHRIQKFRRKRLLKSAKVSELSASISALDNIFEIAAEIYFADYVGEGMSERQIKKIVAAKQHEINKISARFLNPGIPSPWKLGGGTPERITAFFRAIQEYTEVSTGIRPPMNLSFKPKGGEPSSFISLEIEAV